MNEWINGFFHTDAGMLALEGISHGFTSGRVIRLAREGDGIWHSKTYLALDEEPRAATKDGDGTLIVVTWHRLLRIHPATRKVEVLIKEGFWSGLWPNSMIVSDGVVFIGMRHGVGRIEKRGRGYRIDWLVPIPAFDRMVRSHHSFD